MEAINEKNNTTVLKDEENEHPVSSEWRPISTGIVEALVKKGYRLSAGLKGVTPVSKVTAYQINLFGCELTGMC